MQRQKVHGRGNFNDSLQRLAIVIGPLAMHNARNERRKVLQKCLLACSGITEYLPRYLPYCTSHIVYKRPR